jgi:protease-4
MNDPVTPGTEATPMAPDIKENQAASHDIKASNTTKNIADGDTLASQGWERATLEKLVFASLREQQLARRWRTFVRVAWLLFFVTVAWLGFSQGGAGQDVTTPHTAVIEIKGEIASGAEASAELIVSSLRAAFDDAGAQAVVLFERLTKATDKSEVPSPS